MKIKTLNLSDAALDWAVTRALGHDDFALDAERFLGAHADGRYAFSGNWSKGGPIIERECMEFDYDEATQNYTAANGIHAGQGKTHLIAAMRCYVASRLGEEVDVPEELV